MLESMASRYPRPDWVRRINAMADSVGGAQELISLDVPELVERARATTGLDDFGDFDGDWRGRLEGLLEQIEAVGQLNVMGRLMTRQEILRCLRTRLFMTRRLAEAPAILDEEIRQPIIVTGQGRSGTSILFELLSLDPNARSVSGWEAAHPVPEVDDREALLAMTEPEQEFWMDVQPQYASIHEHRSDLPVECITLMMPSFASFQWWMESDIPTWIPDFQASLDFHKVFLQMMQYGKPEATWVLKTPAYLPILDLVFATYPDAWLVLTHRDPMKTIPSGLSTLASVRWQRSDIVELERIAPAGAGSYDLMVHIKQRRDLGELPDRFVDLHFRDLMEEPVGTIRGAYEKIGRAFDDSHAERIRAYLASKPKDKFGSHRYDVSDWGFTREEIREKTRPYIEAYGVEIEEGD